MFQNSIKIGKLFGIEIGISVFWVILFVFFVSRISTDLFFDQLGLSRGLATFLGIGTMLFFYGSILAHEFGHALTARRFGINTRRIILHFFGGVALLEGESKSPKEEFWITIMGPAVSFVLAVFFASIAAIGYYTEIFPAWVMSTAGLLAFANGFMALFNLLPGFPMDGGRLLRSAIWAMTGNYLQSTRIAAVGGTIVGGSIIGLGLLMGMLTGNLFNSIFYIFGGIFIIRLSRSAVKQAEVIDAFRNLTVRDMMRPLQAVIPADMTVGDVINQFSYLQQQELFPVIRGDQLVGQLNFRDITSVPPRQWDWVRAEELSKPIEPEKILPPEMGCLQAVEKLSQLGMHSMAVFEGRRLLGYLQLRDAMDRLKSVKV